MPIYSRYLEFTNKDYHFIELRHPMHDCWLILNVVEVMIKIYTIIFKVDNKPPIKESFKLKLRSGCWWQNYGYRSKKIHFSFTAATLAAKVAALILEHCDKEYTNYICLKDLDAPLPSYTRSFFFFIFKNIDFFFF